MNELTAVPDVASVVSRDGDYEPFDNGLFANRNRERDLIQDKVKSAQTGPILRPLVEFYGVVGLGKTWLLTHLEHFYRADGPACELLPAKLRTCSTRVDFRSFPTPEHWYALLKHIVVSIADQVNLQQDELPKWFQNGAQLPPSEKGDVVRSFTDLMRDLSGRFVLILLFDTSEVASEDLLEWLEAEVVYPIIRTDRALFVFSGRQWLQWKKFEVRRRVEQVELGPFAADAVRDQFEKLGAANIADSVTTYAYGHPLAGKAIFKALRQVQPQPELLDSHLISDNESLVRQAVKTDVVENRFLSQIEVDRRANLEAMLWAVCILRKFNPTPMRYFASQFISPEYEGHDGGYYLDAIQDMQESTLVQWSSAHGGYVLDRVVRWIMAKNLLMRDESEFIRRHEEAKNLYDQWIEKYPRNAMSFLIERTFHRAWVLHARKTADSVTQEKLIEEFRRVLDMVNAHPEIQWDLPDMATALNEELQQPDEELEEVVGQQTYSQFQALAEEFLQKHRGTWG